MTHSFHGSPPGRPGRLHVQIRRLQAFQKLIVVGVGANPEPNHRIAVERAHGTVADSHAGRIGRRIAPDLLEAQSGVTRVLPKKPIGFSCLTLGGRWQHREELSKAPRRARIHKASGSNSWVRPSRYSARASRARQASLSDEAAMARSKSSSSANSASKREANTSCSAGGNAEAFAKASCRSFVMCGRPLQPFYHVAHTMSKPMPETPQEFLPLARRTSAVDWLGSRAPKRCSTKALRFACSLICSLT